MKIGIDCRLWNETGVGRYIRNLVLNLQKLDKESEYVLFVLSKDYDLIISQLSSFNSHLVKADIRWHTLKEQIGFPKILNKENLDLMHFPYFSVPIFYNKPFVVTIHDLIQNHYASGRASTLPFPFYHIKRIAYQKILNHAINKSKKIIVPLMSVKKDLTSTLNVVDSKIVITQEGFDLNITKGKVSERVSSFSQAPYFLYVGNAYPHKNLKILIEGFKILKTNAKLLLVGKKDFFYNRLEKDGVENIIFLHDVKDSELFHLYSHSIAVVSASFMEGFGLVPLEALGAGAIPVVSNIPAFREVCGDLAIYFNPKDKNDIAEKLVLALNLTPEKREKIKEKAKDLLKKFSWEKMTKETLEIYESCVGL